MEPREIETSRAKASLGLAASLAVSVPIFLLIHEETETGWITAAATFFGLCALFFAWLLVRPMRLSLDADGFTLSGGLMPKPRTTKWRDVDEFFVYRVPAFGAYPRSKMVGYNFAVGAVRTPLMRFSRRLGADAGLPMLWSASPEGLAQAMNAYKAQAMAKERSASTTL